MGMMALLIGKKSKAVTFDPSFPTQGYFTDTTYLTFTAYTGNDASSGTSRATKNISTGHVYWEIVIAGTNSRLNQQNYCQIGMISSSVTTYTSQLASIAGAWCWCGNGVLFVSGSSYGQVLPVLNNGDIVGIEYNAATGIATVYKNNVYAYTVNLGIGSFHYPAVYARHDTYETLHAKSANQTYPTRDVGISALES